VAQTRQRSRETEEQKTRRLSRLSVQLAEREHRARREIASVTGALPRSRHGSVTPLDAIEDPERRLEVLKARVERLEALLTKLNRKRETRAKIVMGAALYAEARDLGDEALLDRFRDILDRRVERPQDRLAIVEAFGIGLQPIREEEAAANLAPALPDFDTLIPDAAKSVQLRGGRLHPDYKGLRVRRTAGLNDQDQAAETPPPDGRPKG
jgi:hypothetical protein